MTMKIRGENGLKKTRPIKEENKERVIKDSQEMPCNIWTMPEKLTTKIQAIHHQRPSRDAGQYLNNARKKSKTKNTRQSSLKTPERCSTISEQCQKQTRKQGTHHKRSEVKKPFSNSKTMPVKQQLQESLLRIDNDQHGDARTWSSAIVDDASVTIDKFYDVSRS